MYEYGSVDRWSNSNCYNQSRQLSVAQLETYLDSNDVGNLRSPSASSDNTPQSSVPCSPAQVCGVLFNPPPFPSLSPMQPGWALRTKGKQGRRERRRELLQGRRSSFVTRLLSLIKVLLLLIKPLNLKKEEEVEERGHLLRPEKVNDVSCVPKAPHIPTLS